MTSYRTKRALARHGALPFLALLLLGACGGNDAGSAAAVDDTAAGNPGPASPYLYLWAQDIDRGASDTDFLATVDADPSSARYGAVIATTPVGSVGTGAHHADPALPATGYLFANGFSSGRTFLFDMSARSAPVLAGELGSVPGLSSPHDFRRLPNGNALATMQLGDGTVAGDPGGLALFTDEGELLATSSAADAAFPGAKIRPYALEVVPDRDRVLTTGRSMSTLREKAADVIQIWRLSDLQLLHTLAVPRVPPTALPECTNIADFCDPAQYAGESQPFDIRVHADGSALLTTFTCGFFRVDDIASDTPSIEPVLNWPELLGCSVPALVGRFMVMPAMFSNVLVTVDVSDSSAPREISRYETPEGIMPHWAVADPESNRIVVTMDGPKSLPAILIFDVDPATGALSLDERFGAFEDPAPGISFDRTSWPHGDTGAAMPHAALFGR